MAGWPTCSIAGRGAGFANEGQPVLRQLRRQPLLDPDIAAGPDRRDARRQNNLKYRRMQLAACRPVDRRSRHRLQHLQERLGILDRANALEDHRAGRRRDVSSWQYFLHVQHQQHLPIAQQCRPGIAAGPGEQPLHRLEDDIEPVPDGVDFERRNPARQLR